MIHRFYKLVSALGTETSEYTPADGEKLVISRIGGNSAGSPTTRVTIIWDYGEDEEEVLFSTYSNSVIDNPGIVLEGDGNKILAIILDNDSLAGEYMGAFWEGRN